MTDGFEIVEIVFLAMLAGFIGLRLFSVLGRRTGEERKPVTDIYGEAQAETPGVSPRASPVDAVPVREIEVPVGASPALGAALRKIAKADPAFSPAHFVEGAQAAYRIVLEAFWASDLDGLKALVSDDVFDNFERAVVHRKAEGHSLDNRLLSIDRAEITEAELDGAMAEVTVRFVTQLVAVTRDESGAIVHGAADETLEVHDVWTFSRHTRSEDPSWLLIATDSD